MGAVSKYCKISRNFVDTSRMSSISTGGCGPRPITSDVTRHEAVTRLSRPATWQSSGWETIKLIVNDYPFGPEKIVGLVVSYLKLLFTTEPVDNTMMYWEIIWRENIFRKILWRYLFSESYIHKTVFTNAEWKCFEFSCEPRRWTEWKRIDFL